MAVKNVLFLGNFSTTTTGAQTFTPTAGVIGANTLEYSAMDILFNVKTLSGTSPTTQPSVQERFSDVGFVETANYGATFTTTGKYIVAHDGQTGQAGASSIKYGFSMQGKGTDKQIVFTNGGTIGSISIDVYAIFYGSGS